MTKKKPAPGLISNRRARHDYELGDSLSVGLVLSGAETKALRLGHGSIKGAYVNVINDELWLVNSQITSTSNINIPESEQTRSRKLLIKRRELDKLIEAKKQGLSILPLEIQTRTRYIKLRIAVGRGKKQYDKRETLKKRDEERKLRSVNR